MLANATILRPGQKAESWEMGADSLHERNTFSKAPQTPIPIMLGAYDRTFENTDRRGPRVRHAVALFLAAVLFVGCSGTEPLDTDAEAKPRGTRAVVATPAAVEEPEPTTGVADSDETEDGEGGSGSFRTGAGTHGGSGLDADTLLAVRHGLHDGYERVVLDLGAGDEPAETLPRWTLVRPRRDCLLRVELPSANATAVSDGVLGDGLLEGFHVVRAPERGIFVDVLARGTFRHRVMELEGPARLVIDFRPLGTPSRKPSPATGGQTVLLEPRPGSRISDPLTVSGYSRNFEASNTITLTDSSGKTLARKTVAANDWTSTWGYFEATLDFTPFSGRGTLRVGTYGARDGTFDGVEVPLKGS